MTHEIVPHEPPLSLGFIGGGLSSAVGQVHFGASRMDGRWRLVAGVFSRNPAINDRTAAEWHVDEDRTYPDWRALIEAEARRLDAVVVLTPTPDHATEVMALLDAGIPVICEKALVTSPAEARAVAEHFRPGESFLAVTFNYSGYPLVRELRERVRRGDLGRITQIHLEMPQEGFARPPAIAGRAAPPQAWRLVDGEIPTLCLDLGVHLHHLAAFVTGLEVARVSCRFATYSRFPVVDAATMLLDFDNGATGSFWFSKTALGKRNGLQIRIFGDKGSAEWVQSHPEELHLAFADGRREVVDRGGAVAVAGALRYSRMKSGHPAGFIEAFANLYADIADSLKDFKAGGDGVNPYVHGLDHAARGLDLFAAARRSHETGAWQGVSGDPAPWTGAKPGNSA